MESEECLTAPDMTSSSQLMVLGLRDMPEEILEHILSFLSPYKSMESARLVCYQWNRLIKSIVCQKRRKFYDGLYKGDVVWTEIEKQHKPVASISDRFSHSAAYHDGIIYVFGGCTSTSTTFNDLWTFNLTSRQWVRPIAMGTYPSPKACATMVVYNGDLVLFGGWSHPIPYPLHQMVPLASFLPLVQAAHYFNELHIYSPATNRWSQIHSLGQEPQALGGHSASVVGDLMVVFGGATRPGMGTNNLWVFNLRKRNWSLQPVYAGPVPEPRYGSFQTTVDDSHILIMGGCVGQVRVYQDVWILTVNASGPWKWTKLNVECPTLAAPQTWCHAACRVNDMVIVVANSLHERETKHLVVKKQKKRKRQFKEVTSQQSTSSSAAVDQATMMTSSKILGASSRGNVPGDMSFNGASSTTKMSPSSLQSPRNAAQPDSSFSTSPDKESLSKAGQIKSKNNQSHSDPTTVPIQTNVSTLESFQSKSNNCHENKSQSETCTINEPSSKPELSVSHRQHTNENGTHLNSFSSAVSISSTSKQNLSSTPSSAPVSLSSPSTASSVTTSAASMLALQQRLHRDCLNLPDPDNHHHNPRHSKRCSGYAGVDDDDDELMPEGYFSRLNNRFNNVSSDEERTQSFQHATLSSSNTASGASCVDVDTSSTSSLSDADSTLNETNSSNDVDDIQQAFAQVPPLQPEPHQLQRQNLPLHRPQAPQSYFNKTIFQQRSHSMPSIRPNASSNRQRQLEALQRQEELLRSRSRALVVQRERQHQAHVCQHDQRHNGNIQQQMRQNGAQAIGDVQDARPRVCIPKKDDMEGNACEEKKIVSVKKENDQRKLLCSENDKNDDDDYEDESEEDDLSSNPAWILVPTKNKMDVHILDISEALNAGVVEWLPLTDLQPPEAPEETICCSLLEGRGELFLFGGVKRDMANIGEGGAVSNTAVSKVFLLHSGSS